MSFGKIYGSLGLFNGALGACSAIGLRTKLSSPRLAHSGDSILRHFDEAKMVCPEAQGVGVQFACGALSHESVQVMLAVYALKLKLARLLAHLLGEEVANCARDEHLAGWAGGLYS